MELVEKAQLWILAFKESSQPSKQRATLSLVFMHYFLYQDQVLLCLTPLINPHSPSVN